MTTVLSAVLAFALFASPQTIAISTTQHGTTLKANTKFNATLQDAIDSSTAQVGDTITLVASDPNYPTLRGATITAHITAVNQPNGLARAQINFLFDTIVFGNGLKEQFRGFVVSANVVQHVKSTPPPASQMGMQVPGAPPSSTIAWKMDFGAGRKSSTTSDTTQPTGGHGYATKPGVNIHVPKGTQVTLLLASDLQTP